MTATQFKHPPPKYFTLSARGDTAYAYSDEELQTRAMLYDERNLTYAIYELKELRQEGD